MTRPRIKRRRTPPRPDVDRLGPRVRRIRGVCRNCHTLCDLVHAQGLCLLCFVRLSRGGQLTPSPRHPVTP